MDKYVFTSLLLLLCLNLSAQKKVEKIEHSLMVFPIEKTVFMDLEKEKGMVDKNMSIKAIYITDDHVITNYVLRLPEYESAEIVTMVSSITEKSRGDEPNTFWFYFKKGAMKLFNHKNSVYLEFYIGSREKQLDMRLISDGFYSY